MATHASLANRLPWHINAETSPSRHTPNMPISFQPLRPLCPELVCISNKQPHSDVHYKIQTKERRSCLVWTLTPQHPDWFRPFHEEKEALRNLPWRFTLNRLSRKLQAAEAMKRFASMARISKTFVAMRRCSARGGTGISMLRMADTLICFTPVP